MALLKPKSSSIIEVLVAMVILSISMSALSLSFLHFLRNSDSPKKGISERFKSVELSIKTDPYFLRHYNSYKDEFVDINLQKLKDSDSLWLVELTLKNQNELESKSFIYVQN